MAASPSPAAIRARKSRLLAEIAKERNGKVENGEVILPDGVKVGYSLLRASNGECCLMPYADCEGYVESFLGNLDSIISMAKAKYEKALAKAAV